MSFRRAVEQMVREVANRASMRGATKKLYHILPNYIYLESAYKHAKLVVEGCEKSGGELKHVHIRKLFIISRGNKFDYGNRNLRFILRENFFEVLVRYPWDDSWIKARAFFGEKYIPVLKELSELASRRVEGYGAKVVFRNEEIEVHVSVPLWLYLKHFSKTKPAGYGMEQVLI
ncbi:hypothetical protein [Desulfurococcus amylolyticus]|uniref:hypothetical protein n=1 Tax=Desulfurococcus amylolyticus TaxID=94694 RepID=UPI00022E13CA|nr:hypothetical protein [Desulfurococcus amylolyticus]